MAILSQGILGSVRGKTGPVVSYVRYGRNITQSIGSRKKNKIQTPARKTQREKITVCNEFTKAFSGTGFFNKSFPAFGHTGSGYNRATGALMNLAIVSQPQTAIAWSKVLISKGEIASVDAASVDVNDEGNIIFGWADNAGTGTAKGNDTAILVAYFPETKEAVFQFSDATRNDGFAVLEVDSKKGIAETWLGFLSADEKNAANSVYTGRVTLI
ncbi:MAG TPA: DUF6266 family protein [Hanamia sp.]|jgi:hypothetical protein|nr:DUF6266 family protein [Hanamia sp.]